jgi:hypothetical protein
MSAAVTEAVTAAEAAADEAAQQIMGLQQELASLGATNAQLHDALEDVHAAAASYREQLVAAGDRERELQRQLLQVQLRLEEQADAARQQQQQALSHGSAADEATVQVLLQQRDTANAALADAQDRLLAQDTELHLLRQALQRASHAPQPLDGAAGASQAPAAAARPPPLALGALQLRAQQQQQAAVGERSGSSWLDGLDLASPASLVGKLPPTPGSGASFWLGDGGAATERHAGERTFTARTLPGDAAAATSTAAAAAAAAGQQQPVQQGSARRRALGHPLSLSADSGLAGQRTGLAALAADVLDSSPNDAAAVHMTSHRPSSRLQQRSPSPQQDWQQQVQELASALVAAEATNQRQHAVIAALRQEMEDLQAAGRGGACCYFARGLHCVVLVAACGVWATGCAPA